jgi:hypothetical protein
MPWPSIAAAIILGLWAASQPQDGKMPADQAETLQTIRVSALQYTKNLPDFICTQTTYRRVTDPSGFPTGMTGVSTGGRGVLGMPGDLSIGGSDTIKEHLTFYNNGEHYEVVSVNGEKVSGVDHMQFAGVVSAGEFGSALENIFEPSSNTAFSWDRDSSTRGRRVHVLRFRVPKEHGDLVIYHRGDRQILAAYAGRILIDAENMQILRIASDLELPAGFPIKTVQTAVEYRPIEVAGTSFNLPYESQVRLTDGSHQYVNQIEFRNYHKFSVQSTIHYDGSTQPH